MSLIENANLLLRRLYDAMAGQTRHVASVWKVAKDAGVAEEAVKPALQYLAERALVEVMGVGGLTRITAFGVEDIERVDPEWTEPKRLRWTVLRESVKLSGGSIETPVDLHQVASDLEIDYYKAGVAYDHLAEIGLLRGSAFGGMYTLTCAGIEAYEQARNRSDEPSRHFPPLADLPEEAVLAK